jgi:hypothetical protein
MFDEVDLLVLRDELRQSGLDTFQCAELIAAFLTQRGYGVSHNAALTAAVRTEPLGFPLTQLDRELARIAMVM